MKALVLSAVALVSISSVSAQDLKPQIAQPEVTITNTFKAPPVVSSDKSVIAAKAAQAADLDDLSNVVAAKEQKRKARIEANRQLDLQYKAIPNKPSKFRHPLKRADLWIDYHEDSYRKYRTRVLPIGQGVATVLGMGFAAGAAFK